MNDITEMKLDTAELKEVEVFEIGKWKGVEYTEKDIDEMITNFNNKVADPYLNINHSENATQGFKEALNATALGWVDSLYKKGNKLVANFKQIPKQLAEMIQAGALKKRSIELFKKYKHANGNLYNNVLSAVTFHGADGHPAISTLSDVMALYKNENKQNQKEQEIIVLKNEDKEVIQMDEITLKKNEYDELVKFKSDNESISKEIETLKVKSESIIKENDELKLKNDNISKEVEVFKKEKEEFEKQKAEAIAKEAENYVNSQIESGKVIPASKEIYVENYLRYKNDNVKFEAFKKDIEDREALIFTGAIETTKSDKNLDIDQAIEVKMKNGKSFEEARKEILAEMEV